jgi:16S rRNA (cytosine1402-N4)-methyltransferase
MELHVPVMRPEVLDIVGAHISEGEDGFFLDATLGGGGHSAAILEKFESLTIIGFDHDEMARETAANRLDVFGRRTRIIAANFAEIGERAAELMEQAGGRFIGALFDLGVSNMQLTTPERGFSYQEDGPLDMRMDRNENLPTAADILRESDVRELTRIFRDYGEERHAFRIASAIVRSRDEGYIPETTGELVAFIRRVLPAPVQRKMSGHPARRVFQALRIAVNSELDAIPAGLRGALEITKDGGVIIVIAYHSLEDRIVKRLFRGWASDGIGKLVTRRPIEPPSGEIAKNRKSRSAKLRAFAVQRHTDFINHRG